MCPRNGQQSRYRSYTITTVHAAVSILRGLACEVIAFPKSSATWDAVKDGFSNQHGFSDAAGAIDGTLVPIDSLSNFDGFYCRKSYPALNMQAVVLPTREFMSTDIRPGSWSDRKVWLHSYV